MSRADRGSFAALALFLAIAVAIPAAHAAPTNADRESLRPTGPVKITADRAEWQKGGSMVYTGDVRLDSGDLKLNGDRLTLRQFDDGQFEATVDGNPAELDHAGLAAVGTKEDQRPPVTARAKQLTYDSRTEIVEIVGDAYLKRGKDEIKGENIRYDVAQRRIDAQGRKECTSEDRAQGKCGVVITLQPPPRKEKSGADASAPPAPAPEPTP